MESPRTQWFSPVAWVTTMMLAATLAHADDARIIYYDVVGNTAKELRREMNAKGPISARLGRADGQAKWNVSWKYRYARKSGRCEFTEFSSKVEGTITLPRLAAPGGVTLAVAEKWESFITALSAHEYEHYSYGVKAAAEVQRLGQSFRVPGSCWTIAATFKEQAMKIIANYRAQSKELDVRTRHGRTQGVIFP